MVYPSFGCDKRQKILADCSLELSDNSGKLHNGEESFPLNVICIPMGDVE
ncbi:hypothetical protein ATHL_00491 [Anaerolinea thermolimosa]|nr:hypothetical protein ATHL_00488 [Anaerolinea thermolimosa]GAP05650.1 hypothetical protein ATHL_00491 [Anaerolinea thermolimosa]